MMPYSVHTIQTGKIVYTKNDLENQRAPRVKKSAAGKNRNIWRNRDIMAKIGESQRRRNGESNQQYCQA